MTVNEVRYQSFRGIKEADIRFSPGVNVLIGDNAQGKTNALEGIYLMAAARSFRTAREREMVRFGDDFFKVTLEMSDSRRSQSLSFKAYSAASSKKRECTRNGIPLPRISELVGVFRAVLFTPEHLSIVKAGPSERRTFLDIAISQLKPVYMRSLQRYNRILTQRNALLKQIAGGVSDAGLLDVYSEQLAVEAAYIFVTRAAYIKRLDSFVKRFFDELSAEGVNPSSPEKPQLLYKNSLKTEMGEIPDEKEVLEAYLGLLKGNNAREAAAGATLYGSHKDDIEITLDGREARLYASQGQQRSLALAMKLGEGEISMEDSGEYPVFLFDDVLSELDPQRQNFLLSKLDGRQVIMTACTPPPVESDARFITVRDGIYTEKE